MEESMDWKEFSEPGKPNINDAHNEERKQDVLLYTDVDTPYSESNINSDRSLLTFL
jgi:hypothetical protein